MMSHVWRWLLLPAWMGLGVLHAGEAPAAEAGTAPVAKDGSEGGYGVQAWRAYLNNMVKDWVEMPDYRKTLLQTKSELSPDVQKEIKDDMVRQKNWLIMEYERQRRMYLNGSGTEDVEATALIRGVDGELYAPFKELEAGATDEERADANNPWKGQLKEQAVVDPLAQKPDAKGKYQPLVQGLNPLITGNLLTEEDTLDLKPSLTDKKLEGDPVAAAQQAQSSSNESILSTIQAVEDPTWRNDDGLPDNPNEGYLAEIAGTYPAIKGYQDPLEGRELGYVHPSALNDPLLARPGASPRLDPGRPTLLLGSSSSLAQLKTEELLSPLKPVTTPTVDDTISKDVRDRILRPEVVIAQPVEPELTPRQQEIQELQKIQRKRLQNVGGIPAPFDGFR